VQFLSRSGAPQQQPEAPASVNEAPAETAGAGGWGLAAKQQAAGSEKGVEEDFENLSF
jgi:hypothetical protein